MNIPNSPKFQKTPETSSVQSDLFRRMIGIADYVIFRIEYTPQREFKYINKSVTKISGYIPEDFYNNSIFINEIIHPDDLILLQNIKVDKSIQVEPIQLKWRIKNGTYIWMEHWFNVIMGENQQILAIEGIARNITKRKIAEESLLESEMRFRAIFDNNHTVMLLIDPAKRQIIDANQAAASFYGYSMEEFRGKFISDINTLNDAETSSEILKAVKKQKNDFIFKHKLSNGSIRDVKFLVDRLVLMVKLCCIQLFMILRCGNKLKNQSTKDLRRLKQ